MKKLCVSAFTRAVLDRSRAVSIVANVNSVLLVGAHCDSLNRGELSRNDGGYLETISQILPKYDLGFAEDLDIQVCTLPHYDFLKDTANADMVVFCKIFYDPKGTIPNDVIDRSFYRQSPICMEEAAWSRALAQTGAKWAFNVHKAEVELPTAFLARPPFEHVASHGAATVYDFLRRPAV